MKLSRAIAEKQIAVTHPFLIVYTAAYASSLSNSNPEFRSSNFMYASCAATNPSTAISAKVLYQSLLNARLSPE